MGAYPPALSTIDWRDALAVEGTQFWKINSLLDWKIPQLAPYDLLEFS